MKRASYLFIFGMLLLLLSQESVIANSAPTVSNIKARQRTDGSGIVDISFTLSDADNDKCTVSVAASNDDGGTTWTTVPSSEAFSPGRHSIAWSSKRDLGSNYRVKVTADDGHPDH